VNISQPKLRSEKSDDDDDDNNNSTINCQQSIGLISWRVRKIVTSDYARLSDLKNSAHTNGRILIIFSIRVIFENLAR
jgi:hypothetical protein